MPATCHVVPVSSLLRELIVRATELPVHYDESGPAGEWIGHEQQPAEGRPSHPQVEQRVVQDEIARHPAGGAENGNRPGGRHDRLFARDSVTQRLDHIV